MGNKESIWSGLRHGFTTGIGNLINIIGKINTVIQYTAKIVKYIYMYLTCTEEIEQRANDSCFQHYFTQATAQLQVQVDI